MVAEKKPYNVTMQDKWVTDRVRGVRREIMNDEVGAAETPRERQAARQKNITARATMLMRRNHELQAEKP